QPLAPHVPLRIKSGDEEGTGQWTTCVFRVGTASRPAPQWKVESIALSDATSNVLAPENIHFTKVGDYLVFAFNGAFWSSETPGIHASIVELTDQTGRSIGPGISHKLPTGGRSFLFHTAPGSKTLNITFAVQRSQIVEFAPALRRDNALQANQQLGIPFDQF